MNSARTNRLRISVLAFPTAGLVAATAALIPGIGTKPTLDPYGFSKAADYVGLANLVGIVSLVFLLFGFQALQTFLERHSANEWAFQGMILSVIGLALFLPFLGIFAFAAPVAGRVYLSGDLQAVDIISQSTGPSNWVALAFGGVSVLSSVLGSIFFSMAIWRSGKLPKWSAVAYALSAPLNWTPHYIPALWLLGGILLFGAGTGITKGMWNALSREHLHASSDTASA